MPPKTIKEVQSLNDKIAVLNRFVSRATNRCLPFFRTLKKAFEWTTECQWAFEDLKAYLSSPPLQSPPRPGEELFLYLAVSSIAINAALVREEDRTQKPAHTIVVLTKKQLRRAMSSLKAAGRVALWKIELSEFDIEYRPRMATKGQVIADFIAKFASPDEQGVEGNSRWVINTDGLATKHVGGAGIVLLSLEGDEVKCMIRLDFPITNNEAKYEALIAGLDLAQVAGAMDAIVRCDSQVVTSQITGGYRCRRERMKKYLE
ncbi:uncharacterized protein LOC142640161 [Castanea sativa]|uniref:uncharacterized protein LOC142640161 n=1 Tax=Castanea sativa TaxID=21020 RepID=UPI003F65007A